MLDTEPFFSFHHVNAFEQGDKVGIPQPLASQQRLLCNSHIPGLTCCLT